MDKNKSSVKWVKVDSPFAICIKPSEGMFPVPPLSSLFESILDLADFKALHKGNEEIENYKLLFQQIPLKSGDKADSNEFLLTEDFVKIFHENIEDNLPPQVGLVTSPMKVEPINFERDTVDRNKVGQSTSQLWNESGVSELLFGSNSNSSTALKSSITADETILSGVVRDIERWINEYRKSVKDGRFKFRVRILDTTKFNSKEYFDTRLKVAQHGIPVKNEIIAILGMQPSAMYINSFIENDVLDLSNKLKPLRSSHTTSSKDGGAPNKDDNELTDKGHQTRDLDSNNNSA